MEGVTTAIVGFIFVCVVFPHLVKNKAQWYAALAAVVLVILLQTLGIVFGAGFRTFAAFMTGLLQIGAILLLILSAGGLSPRELAGEMKRAYEVIRRGEQEKEVIIPITGQQPRPREDRDVRAEAADDERIVLEVPRERTDAGDQRIKLEDDPPRV